MAVEARFFVSKISKVPTGGSTAGEVTLQASTKGPHDWSKWTPHGEITLRTISDAASEWFDERLGKDIQVLFADIPEGSE